MSKAKTYRIKYRAKLSDGDVIRKESSFCTKAEGQAAVIRRWKNQLPKSARPNIVIDSCKPR